MTKRKLKVSLIALTLLLTMFGGDSYSRIIQISASDFVFTPATVENAFVGDTIRWTRTSGSHTTTCDGQQFTSRPAGAAPWNALLTSASPTFSYVITVPGTYDYICVPHAPSMAGTIIAATSGITQLSELVSSYELSQNYPNPFNPVTNIKFGIPSPSFVRIRVFDSQGREVDKLLEQHMPTGTYNVSWSAERFSSGVYFYGIEAGGFSEMKKMILIK